MTMHDPTNFAAMGPQITARPGTKRHAKQAAARQQFCVLMAHSAAVRADRARSEAAAHASAEAALREQAACAAAAASAADYKISILGMIALEVLPVSGNA